MEQNEINAKMAMLAKGQIDVTSDIATHLAVEQMISTAIVAYLANRGIIDGKFIESLQGAIPDNLSASIKDKYPEILEARLKGLQHMIDTFGSQGAGKAKL